MIDPQVINGLLTAIVGFFVSRVLRKVDDIDLAAKSISTDVALIKQDRQLIWDKINRMEEDLEELKRLLDKA
jgi:uncharacterized protein YoxC